jgi:perosamine synthetase
MCNVKDKMIPVYKPYLNKELLKYAHDALESGWITHGKYVEMCEKFLEDKLGVKHVLLVNNGTSATHLMVLGLKLVYGKWLKEVIVPNNVYVAAWNSFLFDDCDTSLYPIDADLSTWNFDLDKLDKRIKETDSPVLVVHNMGNIVNVPDLQKKYTDTIFVEDCCEGLFGLYNEQYAGTASLCSSVSFFGNKTITSGEGGAVLTNNDEIYNHLLRLRGQGQTDEKFIHDRLGYNYRLNNVSAGILYGQLMHLDEILNKKLNVFAKYDSSFCGNYSIHFQEYADGTIPANWLYAIRIDGSDYKKAKEFFDEAGIETRPMFYPMSAHKHLKMFSIEGYEEVASQLNKEVIILPCYPELTDKEQDYIIEKVKEYEWNLRM